MRMSQSSEFCYSTAIDSVCPSDDEKAGPNLGLILICNQWPQVGREEQGVRPLIRDLSGTDGR